MRILITGGFGFVGGRLAQHLSILGYEVLLGSRNNHKTPYWCLNAKCVIIDWENQQSLIDTIENVDCIIHAAGMNAQDCSLDNVGAIYANGITTARIVNAAIKNNVKKIIYISSIHVYSSQLENEINETLCTTNLHPYATSHKIGEDVVLKAHSDGLINGVVFRLSNSFGSPAHKNVNSWHLLVNDLCRQCVQDNEIVLQSDGSQFRDFINLSSVAFTIEKAITLHFEKDVNTVFNLCSGKTLSVLEMAEIISKRYEGLTGNKIGIVTNKNNKLFNAFFSCSTKKLEKFKLFTPESMNDEIDSLLKFCQLNFNNG